MTNEHLSRSPLFHPRSAVEEVEEGCVLAPRFPMDGLLPCVTTDAGDGVVLMIGWMNAEALERTIKTGEAHYFSRTRQAVWHKGATSGLVQRVIEMRIDDDQDAIWLRVDVAGNGGSCHVGYRSCFYRRVPVGPDADRALTFSEDRKLFDPVGVYGDAPNPTIL
jgi:phosphoribosyl-AMP cyclohydrolase